MTGYGRDRSRSPRRARGDSRGRGGYSAPSGGDRGFGGGMGGGYGGGYGGDKGKGKGGDRMGALGSNLRDVNWGREDLVKFEKNFYFEHPNVANMTDADVKAVFDKHELSIVSAGGQGACPKPVRTFEEASFPEYCMEGIREFEKADQRKQQLKAKWAPTGMVLSPPTGMVLSKILR